MVYIRGVQNEPHISGGAVAYVRREVLEVPVERFETNSSIEKL